MSSAYLWVKAFHIIAVTAWFAGLFYLPRLFVYHSGAEDHAGSERFKVMERKLLRAIMTPSMVVAVTLGLTLVVLGWESFGGSGWLWTKIALVVLLLAYHHYCGRLVRAFAEDRNPHSELFYRWFNEFPALILLAAVILVVIKPF